MLPPSLKVWNCMVRPLCMIFKPSHSLLIIITQSLIRNLVCLAEMIVDTFLLPPGQCTSPPQLGSCTYLRTVRTYTYSWIERGTVLSTYTTQRPRPLLEPRSLMQSVVPLAGHCGHCVNYRLAVRTKFWRCTSTSASKRVLLRESMLV